MKYSFFLFKAPDMNCMQPLCESCDMSGREKQVASGLTLEECKLKCMNDNTCLGIDFGKGHRSGACYFNYQQNTRYTRSAYYNAYRKDPKCGKFLTYHYK